MDPKSETREKRDSSLMEDVCPTDHCVSSTENSNLRRFAGLAGEQIKALSQEQTVLRKGLYSWRMLFRAGGVEALRPLGRPRKGDGVVAARVRKRAREVAAGDSAGPERVPNSNARSASSRSNSIFSTSLAAGQGSTPAERRVCVTGFTRSSKRSRSPAQDGQGVAEQRTKHKANHGRRSDPCEASST